MAALCAVLALPAAASSPEEERLRQTQSKLQSVRDRLSQVSSERAEKAEALEQAEAELAIVLEAVNEAELAVQRQQAAVEAARERLAELEDEARRRQQVMAQRAVALYRQGTTAPWEALLGAGDATAALERSTYVEVVSRADRAMFEQVEIAQVQVDAQRVQLQEEEAVLERVLEQQREIYAQVEALRDERALALAGVDERLRDLKAEESHLESESRQLAAMARRASQARAARSSGGGSPGAVSASGFTWPVHGRITSGFGRRWGRMHEGIDIGAPSGRAVVAARAGYVSFAGRMGGYGNLVMISHGGGVVTAYAHLSAFAVGAGQNVGAGARIGSIGCTGHCTGPHLHFEVRVGGAPRNPLNYLP